MKRGGGGGRGMRNIFFTGQTFSSLLENRKKKTLSVSFKRLHILNSFEEVKLFHRKQSFDFIQERMSSFSLVLY